MFLSSSSYPFRLNESDETTFGSIGKIILRIRKKEKYFLKIAMNRFQLQLNHVNRYELLNFISLEEKKKSPSTLLSSSPWELSMNNDYTQLTV